MTMHDFKVIKENTPIHEKYVVVFLHTCSTVMEFLIFFFQFIYVNKNTDEKIHNHITVDQQIPNTYYQS